MSKSVVVLLLFAAFLAAPSFSSADESTTINFNFKGLIPGGSCEPEPCEECEECEQCEQCPEGPTKDLVALGHSLGLTTVLLIADACGVGEQFTNPNNTYTIFAPRNEAFDFLPDGFLGYLEDSPDLCAPILFGHVVEAALPTAALVDGMKVPPVIGQFPLTFDLTFGVTVNVDFSSAMVTSADHFATNGVIHANNPVLMLRFYSFSTDLRLRTASKNRGISYVSFLSSSPLLQQQRTRNKKETKRGWRESEKESQRNKEEADALDVRAEKRAEDKRGEGGTREAGAAQL
ncbi:hypothetical protein QOT17_000043 [Balamuthia mandrillaris]